MWQRGTTLPPEPATRAAAGVSTIRSGNEGSTTAPLVTVVRRASIKSTSRASAPPSAGRQHASVAAVAGTVHHSAATHSAASPPAGRGLPCNALFICPPPTRRSVLQNISVVVALLVLAFTIIFIVLASRASPHHDEGTLRYCQTPDCVLHAKLLTVHLNKSFDPCEDFSAYVCSAWWQSAAYREHVKTPVDEVALTRLANFGTLLSLGRMKLPVGTKAFHMYESCMGAHDDAGLYLERFRELMRDMGLIWPDPPRDDLRALDVHLALSYKWQVHLWFEVRVFELPVSGKWLLVLEPAAVLPILLNQYETVKESDSYKAYWMGFYSEMRSDNVPQLNRTAIEDTMMKTDNMDDIVLNSLCLLIFAQTQNEVSFPMKSISDHAQHITSSTWMTSVQKHIRLSPQLSASDDVVLTNDRLLEAIDWLFLSYTEGQLLSHAAWCFVQLYAPIANPKILLRHFGDTHKVNSYRSIFCAAHVEASYKVLVLSLDMASHITQDDQQALVGGFKTLVLAAVNKINNSKWFDSDKKRLACEKLTSLKLEAWPAEKLQTNEQLEKIYEQYPDQGESNFADFWIHTRRAIHSTMEKVRHMNESREYYEALNLSQNNAPSYPVYRYALQSVAVPLYMINAPLYYKTGTKAMFYGGIGFLLALNLVKILHEVGIIGWHPNGTFVDSAPSDEKMEAYYEKIDCPIGDRVDSAFPELPALEIACAALEGAESSDMQDLAKDLPSVNVFFMTLCYMACTPPGFKSAFAINCNKIARHSAIFARAFRCSDKAKMNPERKCNFFG
ncbi:neprilysin-2-like [Dermacentor andersoni]|uniref:neprilysin-2-like n=1 Tax=Dermacentor andersoni TaxID=34620 RepID=UPI003B3B1A88